MKDWISSFIIACSMYSKIPMPQVEWTEKKMKYALCFFPFVGLVIAALMMVFAWIADNVAMGTVLYGCLGTVIPLAVTGGIHLDGFLDVSDARSSFGDRERKLEILKDPHIGAFAVICGGIYLLLYLGTFSEVQPSMVPALAGSYVLIRAWSGWSVVSLPKAKPDGLASTFAAQADTRWVRGCMRLWGGLAVIWMAIWGGKAFALMMFAVAGLTYAYYRRVARKEFGGITGDLAGYFLQLAELLMIGAVVIWQFIS